MSLTRRTLVQFAGGSVAGALLTPAPWRLVKDSALWSENWPGIPIPARGEIRTKFTNCSLCNAACGMRVRCVGEQPVALAPVKGHPLSQGALCPWGIAAHHLPYHPARLREGSVDSALAAIHESMARCRPDEHVAVLDLCPGRTASFTYRRSVACLQNGIYIAPPRDGYAVDLNAARTVLSLGVPLLDGWGTPGNVIAARRHFRLIQAEPVETRTAMFADQWLPIAPGSEADLAAALAGDKPASPQIQMLAKELRENGPSVVLARESLPEVDRLNEILGAPGRTIVARREAPVPDSWKKSAPVTDLASLENNSIRLLLIDDSVPGAHIPWSVIAPKLLNAGALVVTFACARGPYTEHSQFTLPAPVFPEIASDMPASVDSIRATFRITTPLIQPQAATVNPADLVARLAMLDPGDPLRERADAIRKAARGTVYLPAENQSVRLESFGKDEFWKALNQGAAWIDNRETQPHPVSAVSNSANRKIAGHGADLHSGAAAFRRPLAIVFGESSGPALGSPLITKLYRESNLRQAVNRIALGPADAQACGVSQDAPAYLETSLGRMAVRVTVDPAIPPGAVEVADGPRMRDICGPSSHGKVVPA